jgi:hypothetical protein
MKQLIQILHRWLFLLAKLNDQQLKTTTSTTTSITTTTTKITKTTTKEAQTNTTTNHDYLSLGSVQTNKYSLSSIFWILMLVISITIILILAFIAFAMKKRLCCYKNNQLAAAAAAFDKSNDLNRQKRQLLELQLLKNCSKLCFCNCSKL